MRQVFLCLLLLVFAPVRADDDHTFDVPAQAICKNGVLVEVRIFAPAQGTVTVPIPEDVCDPKREPEAAKVPPIPKRPALTT